MKPIQDTVLHRAREFDMRVEPSGEVTVETATANVRLGPNGLAVLDAFRQPRSIVAAVAEASGRFVGEAGVDEFIADALTLLRAGILRTEECPAEFSRAPYPLALYDSPGIQIKLLDDRVRRSAFVQAVREVVSPGDVVLDLGTGCGILAVEAVRAGARHVYAVEPTGMSVYAREVFKTNGVADRVTVIGGWSYDITLPERADVMTYDLVGFEALDMKILEVTADALERLLAPSCRLVPRRITFGVVLVEVPKDVLAEYVITPEHIAKWRTSYGIDLEPLRLTSHDSVVSALVPPATVATLRPMSDPSQLWSLELRATAGFQRPASKVSIEAHSSGERIAALGYTEIDLSDGINLSTLPGNSDAAPHWLSPLWMCADGPPVTAGARVECRYEYLGRGRIDLALRL